MESVWTEDTEIKRREPLPGDREVPAVVIGAGLAGILTAYYLQKEGIRTVVLEADRIGSGQTKNTTAKITSQHNLIYSRLIRTFGRRMAEHYASANETAIGEYERLIREKGIRCDFARCPAYLYTQTRPELLKQETEAAASLGIQATFGTGCELPFPVAGVTRFQGQARFHPLKFLAGMAEEVEVYEQTKVLKVEGRRVETARGTVTAEHIVFASHYPFLNVPGWYFARMHQERSYVLALEGAERLEGMYLGIDQGGLSFRSSGDLLLLGRRPPDRGEPQGRRGTGLCAAAGQGGGNLSRMPGNSPLVSPGLRDPGRASLYRQVFQAQAMLVCGHGLRKMGHDHGHGKRPRPDGSDRRAGMPGRGYFFTPPALHGTGGKRAGGAWRAHGERPGKASPAFGEQGNRAKLPPHGLQAGVEPGGGELRLPLPWLPVPQGRPPHRRPGSD